MRVNISTRSLSGLARRLRVAALTPAAEAAATQGAQELGQMIADETGTRAQISGAAARPIVQVRDEELLARMRGEAGVEADPVLDRIRMDFQRRKRRAGA